MKARAIHKRTKRWIRKVKGHPKGVYASPKTGQIRRVRYSY